MRGVFEKPGENIGIALNVIASVGFDRTCGRARTN